MTGLGVVLAGLLPAQTLTILHSFTGGSDGAYPYAGVILSDKTLYGTARGDLFSSNATVFKVNTDATGFTTLHSFTNRNEGNNPWGSLILSEKTLYGQNTVTNPISGTQRFFRLSQ